MFDSPPGDANLMLLGSKPIIQERLGKKKVLICFILLNS